MMISLKILKVFLLMIASQLAWALKRQSSYPPQFPAESDHFPLPTISMLSMHLGPMVHPHMKLLLESMKWNSQVHFKMINVLSLSEVNNQVIFAP